MKIEINTNINCKNYRVLNYSAVFSLGMLCIFELVNACIVCLLWIRACRLRWIFVNYSSAWFFAAIDIEHHKRAIRTHKKSIQFHIVWTQIVFNHWYIDSNYFDGVFFFALNKILPRVFRTWFRLKLRNWLQQFNCPIIWLLLHCDGLLEKNEWHSSLTRNSIATFVAYGENKWFDWCNAQLYLH